ncbi:hypothetical protein [Nonomuraea sp. C10]|uniref:hypothetical protein n=1 Tax=Nonomuraea sp. C10 TaxID=2600577 RepID=UPI0011CE8C15|nr:hypothetical protein [Nonomuraea sp. C10]TXK40517.1 hypothetical protein FR742_13735 [Nonomuraea sp. C10]
MMRRLAAGVAAAAMGAAVLAGTATPAMADDEGRTRLQIDVNPEPAWRGQPLSVKGKLSVKCDEDYIDGFVSVHHADHCDETGTWHHLGWKRIVILFKPAGSGRWEHVDTVKTYRDGSFHTKVRARTSGTWRGVFEGSRHLAPSEGTDWVKVLGHRHRH